MAWWLATVCPMQFRQHVDTPACNTAGVFLAISLVLFDIKRGLLYVMKGNFVSISIPRPNWTLYGSQTAQVRDKVGFYTRGPWATKLSCLWRPVLKITK